MIEEARTVEEIRETLAQLRRQDQNVTKRLGDLIATQNTLSRDLGKLDLIRAQLGTQAVATRAIGKSTLSDAAVTAKRISAAVQKLDLEQARVKSTLEVVEQVAELKACVLGVTGSMGAPQDWETAAGYLHRASKIPKEIVCGSFAEEIVPSVEVPDPPNVTLENAAESLCGLFLREFEKATKEENGTKVTRFFKLFPLIGRSEVGLNVYGNYVCQGVASQARANLNAGTQGSQRNDGMFYAGALTKLFEYIAGLVDRHGGLVERHYGEGRMVKVIERLQVEADVQGGIIVDTWGDERHIDRKLTDIRSYAFTFLVQSFLPTQNTRNPISRSASPAVHDRKAAAAAAAAAKEEDDSSDMKDVDGFLNEIAIMLSRWSLYCRFLATKSSDKASLEDPDMTLAMPALLTNSSLYRKIQDRLVAPFNQMSTFYFRRSVEKAFQLDEQPAGLTLNMSRTLESNPPYISSAVDDVMYIVNQVVQRTLSTFQREVIGSVIPTISRVLCADFVGMIQRKMRDESYPKPAVQGGLPPESTIVAFLVLANNLDVATDYLKRIVSSKLEQPGTDGPVQAQSIHDSFPFGRDAMFVHSTLTSLQTTFEGKAMELLTDSIYVLFKNVMKARLRPVLADTFRDVDYSLTQDQIDTILREAEADGEESAAAPGAVPRTFQGGWEALTRPLARILTDANFDRLLTATISYLAEVLEKRIWGQYGRINALGAVRLERDMAALVGIMLKGGRYALREHFARCTQICLIMNMEEDEWEEMQTAQKAGEDDGDWKLTVDERERAKNLVR